MRMQLLTPAFSTAIEDKKHRPLKPRSQSASEGMAARGAFPFSPSGTIPMSPSVTLERTIRFEPKGSMEVSKSEGPAKPSPLEARPITSGIEENDKKQSVEACKGGWSWRSFGWKSKGAAEDEKDYA